MVSFMLRQVDPDCRVLTVVQVVISQSFDLFILDYILKGA